MTPALTLRRREERGLCMVNGRPSSRFIAPSYTKMPLNPIHIHLRGLTVGPWELGISISPPEPHYTLHVFCTWRDELHGGTVAMLLSLFLFFIYLFFVTLPPGYAMHGIRACAFPTRYLPI